MAFVSLGDVFQKFKDIADWATSTSTSKPKVRAEDLEALIGSLNTAAVTDPTLSATQIALLKGIVKLLIEKIEIKKIDGTTSTQDARDLRGLAANKPAANTVPIGSTYLSVDTDPHGDAIEISNGTSWVVI
jgi:hypothetical protein